MAINKDFIIPDAGLQVNGASVLSSTLGVNGAVTIANTIAVGNTTITGNVNVSVAANVGGAIRAGGLITGAAGATITGTANASVAINVGANVNLSVSAVSVGNSLSNTVVTQTSVNTGNSTLFTTIGQATGLFGNSTVNTAITQTSLNTGNTTLYTNIGQATALFGNSTVNTSITSTTIRTGNASVFTSVNATALTTNGTLSVTGAATFSNNVTVSGNFTVSGTTTFVNTATLNVADNIITLNSDVGAIAPSENAGVEVNRGSSANVSLIWNETADKWQVTEDGTNFFNIHRKGTDVVLGTDTSGDYVATITSGNGLTGSGTGEGSTPTLAVVAGTELTSNATGVHHNDITRTNTTTGNTSPNYGGTFTAVDTVTTNARGHVTGVNTKTVTMPSSNNTTYDMLAVANTTASNAILRLTDSGSVSDNVFFVGTDEVVTSSNATHIIIDHADVARADATSTASPASGGTFTAVDSVTTNARGHVSAINVKTVTLPVDPNTTYDLLAVANTTTSNAILRLQNSSNANDNVFFVGLDEVVTSSNATHVIIDHADVTRADASSSTSPNYGGTFTAVDSVTTNARGHVTAINVKTVTMPPANNTTYTQSTVANTTTNQGISRLTSSGGTNVDNIVIGLDEITISSNATAIYVDHSDVARSNTTSTASPASGGTFTAVDSVTTNARGHVTALNLKTVTLPIDPDTNTTYDLATAANTVANEGLVNLVGSNLTTDSGKIIGLDEIVISSNTTAIYVDHNDVARANNTSSASPASGGTFTAIDSITTNARGHVTAINTKTVTLPIDPDTNTTYDLATVANTAANEGLINLIGSNSTTDSGKIVGQNEISVSSNATAVYVNHDNVTRSDASSSVSPASGGTFTAVDSVTTNARGHVTAINLKTVTLPVDPDTNTTYTGANGVSLTGTEFRANAGATLVANTTGIHMPAVATAGTSTGGLSAITIDAQGRVTSVTGSAGYVTSSGVTSVSGTTGRITSSGGATPTIDLDTAGTAGSRTGGISAVTTDAYGRVTAVTGSAGYVTSSGVTSVGGTGSVNGLTLSGTVTSTGNLTLGGSVTSVSTSGNFQMNSLGVGTAGSTTAGEIRATNEITAYYSSDRDLKTNITPIEDALDKIRTLSGVMFDWTDEYIEARGGEDGYFVRKHDTGVIAQDVGAVLLPEVVATREDGTLAVKYEKMMGLVIQSINELADLVDEIKTKVS